MLCEDFNCLAGACCFMDPDHCVDGYDSAGCEEAGGEYLGDSTTCADEGVICSPVYGACCEDGAYCTDNVDSDDCNDMGGDFLGADSTCDDEGVTCNTGACCWEKFMDCSHTDYNNCESSGGTWLGYGSSCDNEGEYCDPGPYGACCFDGNCASTYQWECTYNGGSWIGGDCTECSCAYCGTCCIDDECEEDYPYDACELNNGTWLGNVSCTDDLCAPPAPTGACCTDGQCTINTEEDCEGIYLGDDTSCTGDPCDGNEDGPFLGMFYVLVGENLVDDPDPTWTVDVYVEVEAGARLDAVAGDINNPKMVSTTGSFYQNPYGGPTSQDINPALFGTFPDLEYDSFVTIELLTQEGNALSDIGIDWTAFETGGAVNSTDGSWFITPDDPQGLAGNGHDEDCDGIADEYGVRIARLTVRGGDSIVWGRSPLPGQGRWRPDMDFQ